LARTYRHFKVHVSVLTHRKMTNVVSDNELFSLWVKLGLLAIETWAARHDEEFEVSDRQLVSLTNKKQPASAHRVMRRLVDLSPISAQYLDRTGSVVDQYCNGTWRVQFRNLVKKQGFEPRNSPRTTPLYKTSILEVLDKEKKKTTTTTETTHDPERLAKIKQMFIN